MKGLTREQRKQLKADIVEYRKQDHYASECAAHFGVSIGYVYNACHGIDYPWKLDTETMSKAAKQQAEDRQAEDRLCDESIPGAYLERFAPWAEYIGGYTNCDGFIDIRCKVCGTVTSKSVTAIRHGKAKCRGCKEEKRRKAQLEADKARKAKAEQKRFAKISSMKCVQMQLQECACCGKLFVRNGYRTKFCTDVCLKKSNNAITKDRRVRKISSNERDSGITLEKLYQKSGGVCAICGGVCDWNDFRVINGTFIADNNYPSVDHIIPLSKGGKHTWSNVQLAHRICNTKKGNSIALPVEAI